MIIPEIEMTSEGDEIIEISDTRNPLFTEGEDMLPDQGSSRDGLRLLCQVFPDLDVTTVERILNTQGGCLKAAFELLLPVSDPSHGLCESSQVVHARQERIVAGRWAAQSPSNSSRQNNFQVITATRNKVMNFCRQFRVLRRRSSRPE